MFIVYTTTANSKPHVFTLEAVVGCNFDQFFDSFCTIKEITSAVMFNAEGIPFSTYIKT